MGYRLIEICEEYLAEKGLPDNSLSRVYANAVSGLRRFNDSVSGIPKIVELVIDSADRANLPTDYVQYNKIALCANGKMYCLGLNSNLCLDVTYDSCGNPIKDTGNLQGLGTGLVGRPFMIGDTQRNGEALGRLFGIGSDNNPYGEYRIDRNTNQIVFSGLAQTSNIIMEYMADINSIDNDFLVHPYCIEAVKAWVEWKMGKAPKEHYLTEAKIMRLKFGRFNINEWEAAAQSGNQAAPKI